MLFLLQESSKVKHDNNYSFWSIKEQQQLLLQTKRDKTRWTRDLKAEGQLISHIKPRPPLFYHFMTLFVINWRGVHGQVFVILLSEVRSVNPRFLFLGMDLLPQQQQKPATVGTLWGKCVIFRAPRSSSPVSTQWNATTMPVNDGDKAATSWIFLT